MRRWDAGLAHGQFAGCAVKRSWRVTIGGVAGAILSAGAAGAAHDVVVSSKLHRIVHRMIACPAALRADQGRCLAAEQARLDYFVVRDWIRGAAELHGVALTPDEESSVERKIAEQHDATVRAARHFQ